MRVHDTRQSAAPQLTGYRTDNSPQALVAVEGIEHIVRYVNPAFCTLLGRAGEELLNRPFAEAVGETSDHPCIALLDRVLKSGLPETVAELQHLNVGPTPVYWTYCAWAVWDERDRTAGVMIQVTDSTETARFRQQVIDMNSELIRAGVRQQALNVKLQRAMRETHHRIKNNLQVIVALAELQVEPGESAPPELSRILAHVRTLASLHDLLTQHGPESLEDDAIPAQTMLNRVLAHLAETAEGRTIRQDIAPIMLSTSQSTALALLVTELVSNAIKHGGAHIDVTLSHDENAVHASVTDDGVGFPPDFSASREGQVGLDLVLSIAQHDLRGSVEFSNGSSGGAHVALTFPVPEQPQSEQISRLETS